MVLKENNQLLGYCGIAIDWIDGKHEKALQYEIDSRYWGQGLATEAASAAIKAGFEQFNLPYVLAIVIRENPASVRVLEKVGMQHERVITFHGVKMDVYRIINAAYEMSTRKGSSELLVKLYDTKNAGNALEGIWKVAKSTAEKKALWRLS